MPARQVQKLNNELKQVDSVILIEELETDGHSPLKFICSDGAVYFVKYRSGKSFDKNEINCLVFEMVCTRLLRRLQIPTPDHALVKITDGSYVKGEIRINKRYIKPGIIGLGSKEIDRANLVNDIESIKNKKEFNRFLNPDDLIRIAIFDLWVDNNDRYAENFNLLTAMEEGKLKFVAIDHAFAFGGLKAMNIFNATTAVSSRKKLIESQYFKSFVRHIIKRERLQIAATFLSLLKELPLNELIDEVFEQIPPEWEISPTLKGRILAFLQSEQRLLATEQVTKQLLYKSKSGKS